MVVLQILGSVKDEEGVAVRYKLVQAKASNALRFGPETDSDSRGSSAGRLRL